MMVRRGGRILNDANIACVRLPSPFSRAPAVLFPPSTMLQVIERDGRQAAQNEIALKSVAALLGRTAREPTEAGVQPGLLARSLNVRRASVPPSKPADAEDMVPKMTEVANVRIDSLQASPIRAARHFKALRWVFKGSRRQTDRDAESSVALEHLQPQVLSDDESVAREQAAPQPRAITVGIKARESLEREMRARLEVQEEHTANGAKNYVRIKVLPSFI